MENFDKKLNQTNRSYFLSNHSLTNRLKTHVNCLGGGVEKRGFSTPPRIFQRGTSRPRSPLKIFFAVFVQICSSEKIFGVFNICCFFRILGQKKISLKNKQNLSIFEIFFVGEKIFFETKIFWEGIMVEPYNFVTRSRFSIPTVSKNILNIRQVQLVLWNLFWNSRKRFFEVNVRFKPIC